jgi:hypothetical protein
MIASECAPVAKVGGLGDVVFGLSRELEIRGNPVEIILPKYDCLRYNQIFDLQIAFKDLWVPWHNYSIHCSVYFGFVHGRKCFFIEPHSDQNYFHRRTFYGQADDDQRFAFFSKAALEFLLKSGKNPDIIHCHDWQTGLVPVMLYEMYKHAGMTHPRVCYTLHNVQHQGVTREHILRATGLNRHNYFFHPDRLQDNFNHAAINMMKGGIVYSNFVTTVSPKYAWEIMISSQNYGLGQTLHVHPNWKNAALRDVTATVESIPLIASSIMSKKIAEGTGALVLDVKVGSGAFMKNLDDARELARTMVELGGAHGVRTVAVLTDMSTPLGLAIGNAVEVSESLDVLAGGGPPDVVELTLVLAREMLAAAGVDRYDPADLLADGRAMDSWRAMIRAQGGDPDAPMPVAPEVEVVRAATDGYVAEMDAYALGVAAWRLGAGRARKEDPVSVPAGIVLHRRPGDAVRAGDPLYELRASDAGRIPAARDLAAAGVRIEAAPVAPTPLVLDRIGGTDG